MMAHTASSRNAGRPDRQYSATRSSTKHTAYSTRYFSAVFHRPSVSSRIKGSTLSTGLTMFITPLLPVDSISDVTVTSISSLVRGSSSRPRRFAVWVRASIRRYRP